MDQMVKIGHCQDPFRMFSIQISFDVSANTTTFYIHIILLASRCTQSPTALTIGCAIYFQWDALFSQSLQFWTKIRENHSFLQMVNQQQYREKHHEAQGTPQMKLEEYLLNIFVWKVLIYTSHGPHTQTNRWYDDTGHRSSTPKKLGITGQFPDGYPMCQLGLWREPLLRFQLMLLS